MFLRLSTILPGNYVILIRVLVLSGRANNDSLEVFQISESAAR